MGSVSTRAFAGFSDVALVQDVARRAWPSMWHPGGLGCAQARSGLAERIMLLFREDRPIGWAGADRSGATVAQIDPNDGRDAHLLVEWCLAATDAERLEVSLSDHDVGLVAAFGRAGFEVRSDIDPIVGMFRAAHEPPSRPPCPPGYSIRATTRGEVSARVETHRALVVGSGDSAMTPHQLLADYGLPTPAGVTLLHAMRVNQVGAGCSCAAHASVRTLLGAAIEDEADLALIDMEAGLEHLSRSGGTLAHADVLLIVMEPSRKSVLTAARTMALAEELGIPRLAGVGNKPSLPDDGDFFAEVCAQYGVPLAGIVPYDDEVAPPTGSAHACIRPPGSCVRPSRPSSTSSSRPRPSGRPCWPRRRASTAASPS